jgi:DNA-binding beta-propeller fold protein YncE
MRFLRLIALVAAGMLSACSGEDPAASSTTTPPSPPPPSKPECAASADCTASADKPLCDGATGTCVVLPAGNEIGVKDGTPASVTLVTIYEPDQPRMPTDLAFHPDRTNELWVVNRKDDSVITIKNPGAPDAEAQRRHDPNAMHFMHLPPAIAFGAGDTFGTCGDGDGGNNFMGPALFSADPAVFAKATPDGLGSHLDMLHSTSFCKGIAHVEANVFWVFGGLKKSLDKYDFQSDHGPGNDDHADGEVYRYVTGQVLGVTDVPSHIFYNAEDKQLYVADTGHKRIVKLDTTSGTLGKTFSGLETIKARKYMDGATLTELVPPGTLEVPSGIEVQDGLVFVTDNATSKFYAFDPQGQIVRTLDTGLPAGSLAGFTFGPDGRIYFVDMISGRVYRIDPLL